MNAIKTSHMITVVGFVLFVAYVVAYFTILERCNTRSHEFLTEIFSYDHSNRPIRRKDVFINGKIPKSKKKLLIGVPTVYRLFKNKEAYYLQSTLKSLIKPLSKRDQKDVAILVILADREAPKRRFIFEKLQKEFIRELDDGLITIIGIPNRFYPPLENIPPTFGDKQERMYWRSKQSLDYIFIFQYAFKLCEYYVQLEDDVKAKETYYKTILKDIETLNHRNEKKDDGYLLPAYRLKTRPWLVMEYFTSGFIGRLIPARYLQLFAKYTKNLYDQLPVDLTYIELLKVVGYKKNLYVVPQFEHMGKQSSSLGT